MTIAHAILAAALPHPTPIAPPGASGFITILNFAMWIALGICILGIMITAAAMAINVRRGQASEHIAALTWAMAGAVIIGGASGVVALLTGTH